jgi:hypothetical protein
MAPARYRLGGLVPWRFLASDWWLKIKRKMHHTPLRLRLRHALVPDWPSGSKGIKFRVIRVAAGRSSVGHTVTENIRTRVRYPRAPHARRNLVAKESSRRNVRRRCHLGENILKIDLPMCHTHSLRENRGTSPLRRLVRGLSDRSITRGRNSPFSR